MKPLFLAAICVLFISCPNPADNTTGQNPPPPSEPTYYEKEVSNVTVTPTGLNGGYELTLNWENPTDKNLAGIRIYNLDTDPENLWHEELAADKTSLFRAALPAGSTYTFLIKCVDKNGKVSQGVTTDQVYVQPTNAVGILSADLYGYVFAFGSKTLTPSDFDRCSLYNSSTMTAYAAKTLTFTHDKTNSEILVTGIFEAEGRSDHRKMELVCDDFTGLLKQKGTVTNLENGKAQTVSKVEMNKEGLFISLKGSCSFGISLTVEPEEMYDTARSFSFYRW